MSPQTMAFPSLRNNSRRRRVGDGSLNTNIETALPQGHRGGPGSGPRGRGRGRGRQQDDNINVVDQDDATLVQNRPLLEDNQTSGNNRNLGGRDGGESLGEGGNMQEGGTTSSDQGRDEDPDTNEGDTVAMMSDLNSLKLALLLKCDENESLYNELKAAVGLLYATLPSQQCRELELPHEKGINDNKLVSSLLNEAKSQVLLRDFRYSDAVVNGTNREPQVCLSTGRSDEAGHKEDTLEVAAALLPVQSHTVNSGNTPAATVSATGASKSAEEAVAAAAAAEAAAAAA